MGRRASGAAWHDEEAEGKRAFTVISDTFRLRALWLKTQTETRHNRSHAAARSLLVRLLRGACSFALAACAWCLGVILSAGAARRDIDRLGLRPLRSAENGRRCTWCLQPGAVGPAARSLCGRGGTRWEPGRREERVAAAELLKAAGLTVKGRSGSQQLWSARLAELTYQLSLWESPRFD